MSRNASLPFRMLTRGRQPGANAAHLAARLFSSSSSRAARKTRKSSAPKGGADNEAVADSASSYGIPQRQESSTYTDLLRRAGVFQNHPAYQQLVAELNHNAERDLGRPLTEEENAPEYEEQDLRRLVFERDPNNPDKPSPMAQEILQNLEAAQQSLNEDDIFAGQPQEMIDELRRKLALKAETEREDAAKAQEDDEYRMLLQEDKENMESDMEDEEIENARREDIEALDIPIEDADFESPFLEGPEHRSFNPLSLRNIDPHPNAVSPVAFRMISIQRQFLHYMRLIEGDMFMLQGQNLLALPSSS